MISLMRLLHLFHLSTFKRIAPRMGCVSLVSMLDVRLSLHATGGEGGNELRLCFDMKGESAQELFISETDALYMDTKILYGCVASTRAWGC